MTITWLEGSKEFSRYLRAPVYSDIVIKCGGQSIDAHRIILSRYLEYFKDVGETCSLDLNPKYFKIVLSCIYGDDLNLTRGNIKGVYTTAVHLGANDMLERIHRGYRRDLVDLTQDDVVYLIESNLSGVMTKMSVDHLADNIKVVDCVKLPHSVFRMVMLSDHLDVKNETEVFLKVREWIAAHPGVECGSLYSCVEFDKMPPHTVQMISKMIEEVPRALLERSM